LPHKPIPADAHVKGILFNVIELDAMPIHTSLLADGRVFHLGSTQRDVAEKAKQGAHQTFAVWNPASPRRQLPRGCAANTSTTPRWLAHR
jgi:hypothetical protein